MVYFIPRLSVDNESKLLTTAYQDVFVYNGVCFLEEFEMIFTEDGWAVKVIIDGIDTFELEEPSIRSYSFIVDDIGSSGVYGQSPTFFKLRATGRAFYCRFNHRVICNSSLKIQAKRIEGSPNLSHIWVCYFKEVLS